MNPSHPAVLLQAASHAASVALDISFVKLVLFTGRRPRNLVYGVGVAVASPVPTAVAVAVTAAVTAAVAAAAVAPASAVAAAGRSTIDAVAATDGSAAVASPSLAEAVAADAQNHVETFGPGMCTSVHQYLGFGPQA